MSNYTVRDLEDNLNYLAETKRQIKLALNNKGAEIQDSDTFRSYVSKINELSPEPTLQTREIIISENGEYTINAQEGYDALEEVDLTVSVESGVASANVYCQLTEPENKNGIWLQTNDIEPTKIIAETNIVQNETWRVIYFKCFTL